jgi:hypothetical protein
MRLDNAHTHSPLKLLDYISQTLWYGLTGSEIGYMHMQKCICKMAIDLMKFNYSGFSAHASCATFIIHVLVLYFAYVEMFSLRGNYNIAIRIAVGFFNYSI